MSTQPPKPSAVPASTRAGGKPASPGQTGKARHDEDEVLHVPKGVSRKTYVFLVGLLIFLLVIWMNPGSLFGIAGDEGNRNPVTVRFTLPGQGEVEWTYSQEIAARRMLEDGLRFDAFLSYTLGIQNILNPRPEELLRILVLDQIALSSGVEISDADLASHLMETLEFRRGTPEQFKEMVRLSGLDQVRVEEAIRQMLRVSRFLKLVGFAGALPDPAKIEEQWHKDNKEFAFDYVALESASLKEDARQHLPDEAGLQAWYTALPEDEKKEFQTPEKRTAELALFRNLEKTPAAELLATYPEKPPEGVAPTSSEELANQYYRRVFTKRFLKPPAEGQDPATPSGFFSFEEVREQCLTESPVYHAMLRWIEDLAARKGQGETIDFATEAGRFGLDHLGFLEPQGREEFAQLEGIGDEALANAVFGASADGSVYGSPVSLPEGIAVVRILSSVAPVDQPFETIRDQVADRWLQPKAEELAREKLAALRSGFESFEPPAKDEDETPAPDQTKKTHHRASAEAFRSAAEQAGFTVETRDYLNRAGPATKDPQSEDEEHRTLFSQANAFGLYELETDEVAEPGLGFDKKKAYLVRLAGKRDVPIENMAPKDYQRYKQSLRSRAVEEIGKALDLDYLRKNYGLWLYADSEEAKAKESGVKAATEGK